MTTIGAGWKKTDKNGKPFISLSIDKALIPLTIDGSKKISVFPISEKQSEKSPDFRVVMFVPENKEDDEEPKTDLWD